MSYTVKVIVYTADDPELLRLVRKAVESNGVQVQEFTPRATADGEKELYIELCLKDANALGSIVRRVEAVRGAAIMAVSKPDQAALSNRKKG